MMRAPQSSLAQPPSTYWKLAAYAMAVSAGAGALLLAWGAMV